MSVQFRASNERTQALLAKQKVFQDALNALSLSTQTSNETLAEISETVTRTELLAQKSMSLASFALFETTAPTAPTEGPVDPYKGVFANFIRGTDNSEPISPMVFPSETTKTILNNNSTRETSPLPLPTRFYILAVGAGGTGLASNGGGGGACLLIELMLGSTITHEKITVQQIGDGRASNRSDVSPKTVTIFSGDGSSTEEKISIKDTVFTITTKDGTSKTFVVSGASYTAPYERNGGEIRSQYKSLIGSDTSYRVLSWANGGSGGDGSNSARRASGGGGGAGSPSCGGGGGATGLTGLEGAVGGAGGAGKFEPLFAAYSNSYAQGKSGALAQGGDGGCGGGASSSQNPGTDDVPGAAGGGGVCFWTNQYTL